jgi:hypothetical protein
VHFSSGLRLLTAQTTAKPDIDPRIQQLVASVSQQRLQELNAKLATFDTRETLSKNVSSVSQWILEELKSSSPRLSVSFDTYPLAVQPRVQKPVELRNVIAILPGKTARRIYITGHYDSVNLGPDIASRMNRAAPGAGPANPQAQPTFDHDAVAPGANDDGSGTALTMELARVFAQSGIEFEATLVFALWAGEEQGHLGSGAHAQKLAADNGVVDAMLSNDIVGNIRSGNGTLDSASVRVYSVGPEDSMSRSLARYIESTAALYVPAHRVRLMAREDRFGRGSDHSAFTAAGYPAVVFRESKENFARQHSVDDTIDGVDFPYLAQNARVNAAAAAALALAPAPPRVTGSNGANLISRDPSGYDATLRWMPSAGAVGYRVYWRDTWSNDWQHHLTVGAVTQFSLPNLSIDDFVFGVSAIGADGHESLIRAYVEPVRRATETRIAK